MDNSVQRSPKPIFVVGEGLWSLGLGALRVPLRLNPAVRGRPESRNRRRENMETERGGRRRRRWRSGAFQRKGVETYVWIQAGRGEIEVLDSFGVRGSPSLCRDVASAGKTGGGRSLAGR
ncbi:MAG: hypothetical protein Kow00109_14820 [Acidobacteriota bacterium]